LGLESLPPLDEALSAKDKGQMFHTLLDQYVKTESNPALEKLIRFSKPFFEELGDKGSGVAKTFWWYRFKRICQWWHDKLDTELVSHRATEISGEITLLLDQDSVLLKSRADRIECPLTGAALRIIDYKTGTLPTRKAVETGMSPQLLVEAAIADGNGFGDLFSANGLFQLEYWRLTGAEPAGECLVFEVSHEDRKQIKFAIEQVVSYFLRDDSPYLAAGSFTESRSFARTEEWEATNL
jgi:ATP-dependent helicase/nuclease subunit B